MYAGVVVLLLLSGTGIIVAAMLRVPTPSEAVLAAYVVAFAEIVGLSLFLSPFADVKRGPLIAGTAAVFVGAVGAWLLLGSPRVMFPAWRTTLRLMSHPPVLVLGLVVGLALAYVVALILGTPPNGWDPLNYHLARAAFWLQSGRVGYIHPAYDERLNFNPPNAEVAMAYALGVTRNEASVGFVQLFAALACAGGVFALARRYGLGKREAVFASLLFLSLPIVLLQASGAKNDLVVASFLVCATVFVVGRSWSELGLGALSLALAVGTKFTAAYGIPILLALAWTAGPRAHRPRRLLALGIGAVAGAYWYGVNAFETGRLLGDQSNAGNLTAPLHPRENLLTAYGLLVDTFDVSGAEGADIWLYVIAAVVVGTALFTLSRRRRGAAWTIAGATAVVASPLALALVSERVGRPILLRLYEWLDRPDGYIAIGDSVSSSPRTASDTASWFGPVGFLLVLGAAVAAIVLIRRRSLPRLAWLAAAAPLAWFALVALTLTYHPWQGRFFIYPVAVSAGLWGLAHRERGAAWAATALATVTALLVLVHYTEKPSGVRLLASTDGTSVWRLARWQVQSQHDPPLAPILRFFDEDVPQRGTVALALGPNDFGYPFFGAQVARRVELVQFGSDGGDVTAMWLYANPQRAREIDRACWRAALESERGTIFRRLESCA
jgi:cytochrome c-type biogenesis protein CcmH/NrfF